MKILQMPKVVADTTPLLALLKINKLELLHQVYGTLYVPEAVFHEIEKGVAKPYYVNLKTISWIKIEPIKNLKANQFFTDLDEGEAEVIMLATEISADLVLMDETMGRQLAQKAGLVCTGTIGGSWSLVAGFWSLVTGYQQRATSNQQRVTSNE